MNNKFALYAIAGVIALAALAWLAFGYFGIQALFLETVVDETVPIPVEMMQPRETEDADEAAPDEASMILGPRLVADGAFIQGDSTYSITGKVIVTEQNGVRTLAFTEFDVTNGPDLFVYLARSASANNNAVKDAVREGMFVNLAPLKGNRGNQTYELPAEINFDDYDVVSIWCRRFARNFGAAQLEAR